MLLDEHVSGFHFWQESSQILACTELVKEATDTVAQVAAIEEVC